MIDIERGVRTSGARFAYLTGPAVRLQLALVRHGLDFAQANGFVPVITPVLVREEAMYGTGFFPTDQAQIYATRDDEDRKSTRLNSSHRCISYAVFCLKK